MTQGSLKMTQRLVGPGVPDAAARAAEYVVPLGLLLAFRYAVGAVRLRVASVAITAVILVVFVLGGLLGR